MSDFKIICVEKDIQGVLASVIGLDRDQSITRVGLEGAGIHTVKEIINFIESGQHNFFVEVDEKMTKVIVKSTGSLENRKYITTIEDDSKLNNLGSLPRCKF